MSATEKSNARTTDAHPTYELPDDIEHAIVRLANTGLGSPQLRILIFKYIQARTEK